MVMLAYIPGRKTPFDPCFGILGDGFQPEASGRHVEGIRSPRDCLPRNRGFLRPARTMARDPILMRAASILRHLHSDAQVHPRASPRTVGQLAYWRCRSSPAQEPAPMHVTKGDPAVVRGANGRVFHPRFPAWYPIPRLRGAPCWSRPPPPLCGNWPCFQAASRRRPPFGRGLMDHRLGWLQCG